jgi:isoquinoline 1-oxidoreductase subunit beta
MKTSLSRRGFLGVSLAAGASLVIPVALGACSNDAAREYPITDWIEITPENKIFIGVSQPEVGQGSYTVLPQIVADQMDADWQLLSIRFVSGLPAYRISFHTAAAVQSPPIQTEGGSMSTTLLFARLCVAGAQARDVLLRAAAQRWNVDVAACTTGASFVTNVKNGARLSYGELAAVASSLSIDPNVALKSPERYALIGKPLHRTDVPAKCDGSAICGIDVSLPNMLNAAIKIAPSFTGTLVGVSNEAAVAAMEGVRAVVHLRNAVAVVADKFWQAKRAADALQIEFAPGAAGTLSSASIDTALQRALSSDRGVTALDRGDARSIVARSPDVVERRFTLPHIAHAPMEPVNATAHVSADGVEVWGPIQSVYYTQTALAEALHCDPAKVKINVTFAGGSFGRKIVPDFVVEAALVSKAVGRPVKLLRTREEDMQHDAYRPNAGARIRATLDERGYPLAVDARVAGQSLFAAIRPAWLTKTPEGSWDASMVDGIVNQSYVVPHFHVDVVDTPLPVPVYFMRSVGSTAAVFFWESFIGELAARAGIDPYEYRRTLLAHDPLALAVLDAAAHASGWSMPPPPNVFRGIAYNCYNGRGGAFTTYVAEVAEIEETSGGFVIRKITCAVDAGLVVNPNTLTAQIQGGIGFGLTNTLKSRITFSAGATDQSNWNDYPLLTMSEMPEIVPIIVRSDRPPQGFGEVVLAPVAPAVAAAVFAASGTRLDSMPFPTSLFA